MKILIPDKILLRMETWCTTAGIKEVSGLGTVEVKDGDIHVTGAYLLDMGSAAFTEIPPERIAALYQQGVNPSALKLWWHRHPVGNGKPGTHNWSQTDDDTILQAPLGSSPELVKWSVSIVRTPLGWVGRVDHYGKRKTNHLEVVQPFTPKEHEALLILGSRRAIALPRKTYKPVGIKEGRGIVNSVCNFLHVKRSGMAQNWLHRRMTECGIEYEEYEDMLELAVTGVAAETISDQYGVELRDMRELGIITWTEMEEAMNRRYDTRLAGQQDDWDEERGF